jgi:hypothetical protein
VITNYCWLTESEALSVVAPQKLLMVTARFATLMVFHTDGSLIDGYTEFAIHRAEEFGFSY